MAIAQVDGEIALVVVAVAVIIAAIVVVITVDGEEIEEIDSSAAVDENEGDDFLCYLLFGLE